MNVNNEIILERMGVVRLRKEGNGAEINGGGHNELDC